MAARGPAWLPGGMHGKGGHAWDMTRYGDTINERVVRILLECILVYKCTFTFNAHSSQFKPLKPAEAMVTCGKTLVTIYPH